MKTYSEIMTITFLTCLAALLFAVTPAYAVQSAGDTHGADTRRDSVRYGFLPALGYSSDIGFVGGGVLHRYHYRDGMHPFYNSLQSSALATTRGLFSLTMLFDQVETFGSEVRSTSFVSVGRILQASWFGKGNDTTFDKDLWNDNYYFYETYFGALELKGRKTIWQRGGAARQQVDNRNGGNRQRDLNMHNPPGGTLSIDNNVGGTSPSMTGNLPREGGTPGYHAGGSNPNKPDNVPGSQARGKLDVMLLVQLGMQMPRVEGATNLLSENPEKHIDGAWNIRTGAGLFWENRDNEYAPTRGNTAQIQFSGTPGLLFGGANWSLMAQVSQFFTREVLIFPVTLALKAGYHQTGGDVRFWDLPIAGGEYSIRGFADGRFRGDASLYYTAELRTWLFQIPEHNFKIGGQLFTDAGRVFVGNEMTGDFFKGHKRTFGLGGAVSLFTNEFIIRGDLGFSDEMSRFYLGIGYTF